MPIPATPVVMNPVGPPQDPFNFSTKPSATATRYAATRAKSSNQVWWFLGCAMVILLGVGLQQLGTRLVDEADRDLDKTVNKSSAEDRATIGMSPKDKGMYLALKRELGEVEGPLAFQSLMRAKNSGLNIYGLDKMDFADFMRELRGIPPDQQEAAITLRNSGWKSD